jgi:hypothetical protein
MLGFIKKLFGSAVTIPAETPAPYKVETPAPKLEETTFPITKEVKKVSKKPAVKKATTRIPKTPKPN